MFTFERMFEPLPTSFNTQYRCFSVSMIPGNEREDVEEGGKIIMPPSALDVLTRLNIVYPMLFKLTNVKKARTTHSGVLEFVADEGKVYLPYWMMRNLLLEEGDLIQVQSASLPIATFAQFQPQSVDFLDISNPKAVLENALRSFACLTKSDMVAIKYNNKIYELFVMELKPGNAVSIIECDMQVDFAAPVGYVDPVFPKQEDTPAQPTAEEQLPTEDIVPVFPGKGQRLDGRKKRVKETSKDIPQRVVAIKRGIPDLAFKVGKITFKRIQPKSAAPSQKPDEPSFAAFQGEGNALRKKKY